MNPLIRPTAETSPTMQNYPPPTYLKHRPIFMMPYEPFDGKWAADTDALYLSLGLGQWRSSDETDELSVKVWRMPEEKWSRQSEELPLHRAVDLCIFLTKTLFQNHNTSHVAPSASIPAGTFEHQTEQLELRRMVEVPAQFAGGESDRVKHRLRKLRDELNAADLG